VSFQQKKEKQWEDFDWNREETSANNGEEMMRATSKGSIDTVESDYVEDSEGVLDDIVLRKVTVKKIMVIGSGSIGKKSLIRNAYKCKEDEGNDEGDQRELDLVMKREEEEGEEVRYKFWIRNIWGETKKNYEEIFKAYYKGVAVFVFMYSITRKETLEIVENEIEKVMKEVGNERFIGVLVGSKSDLEEEREVTVFEGIALQEKFKLAFFIETNWMDCCLKEKIGKLMKEGGECEAKGKDHCSILSWE